MSPYFTSKAFRLCLTGALLCLSSATASAQGANVAPPAAEGVPPARVSAQEATELVSRIKAVESPAFRAYLYARVVAMLKQRGGDDPSLRQAILDAAGAGVADISEHEDEIPEAPASGFYRELMEAVRARAPEEAERLKKAHPLQRELAASEEARAGAAFNAAVAKLGNPKTAEQAAKDVGALLASGRVAPNALMGEVLRLDQLNSPALPQLLSSVLALEEGSPGALPPRMLFFLAHLYLRDSTARPLRVRFLNVADRATRLGGNPAALDHTVRTSAVRLLQTVLPHMRSHAPELYAEASARLVALAPGAQAEDAVYTRIKSSSDPLAQTLSEATAARDPALKRELTESAARLARQKGRLRQSAELMASAEEREPPEAFSPRDEFLDGVVQDALKVKDVETARYAASHITRPVNRAEALRRIGRHFAASADAPSLFETLDEAAKALADAPEVKEKAAAYFGLAADLAAFDEARARSLARAGVKVVNSISRPAADLGGKFTHSLFPLADKTIGLFRRLASADRGDALGLAAAFDPKEFAIAATLGAYSPEEE